MLQAWGSSFASTREGLTENEEPSVSAPEAPAIKLADTTESAILGVREALRAGLRRIHTVLSGRLQEPPVEQVALLPSSCHAPPYSPHFGGTN